jgi:ketosteroid isomerase-like protein
MYWLRGQGVQQMRFSWYFAIVLTVTAVTAVATEPSAVEGEISRLEQACNEAYAANDLPKYFDYYADDAILIFYNARTTVADYRRFWTKATRTDPIESVKLSDLVIRVGPSSDVAIASYQIDVRTRHANRKSTDEHAFETDVWLKRGGAWKLAHAQYSTSGPPPTIG